MMQISRCLSFSFAVFLCAELFAQEDSLLHRRRSRVLCATSLATAGASYAALNELWYKNYARTSLHSFNDNSEWMQVDKIGHAFTSYTLTRYINDLHAWANPSKKQYWKSASTSMLYMTTIEILDGRSNAWGFSWGDMIANASGIFTHAVQHFYWNEQRIVLKFSYSPSSFAYTNEEVLGRNFQQRILKDYNGQTYWASYNISSSLASGAAFPKWMNIAIGYGVDGLTSAKIDVNSVNNFQRTRSYYLSFDADLNRVRCKKIFVKRLMRCLSFIKLPSPTLEIQNDGQMKFHFLFF